jgi:hypothetical protein
VSEEGEEEEASFRGLSALPSGDFDALIEYRAFEKNV